MDNNVEEADEIIRKLKYTKAEIIHQDLIKLIDEYSKLLNYLPAEYITINTTIEQWQEIPLQQPK